MEQRKQALAEQANRIMSKAERKIWVHFRKEGIHCYPAAATDPALNTAGEYDVSFLANPHRHVFHFRVWIDVFHNDRDIEFIQFKRWLENLYTSHRSDSGSVLELDWKSCEMIADDLYIQIASRYPERAVWIEVAEDGENGCLIKYELSYPTHSIKI
jgi:hypothetical protein